MQALAVVLLILFAFTNWCIMPTFTRISTSDSAIITDVITYDRIVCLFSFELFLESVWTKILQAGGDMKTPIIDQIVGAITNIMIDPLLIFGMFVLPEKIFPLGIPNILMLSAYTFYILGLNWFWLTFPVTEIITSCVGVIIIIAREHGSFGKQIGKLVAEKMGIPTAFLFLGRKTAPQPWQAIAQRFVLIQFLC